MDMKNFITIVIILLCFSPQTKAQQHYSGVSSIEFDYGLNIFGRNNTYLNFSISKYKNRTTYWKGGLNFIETSYVYSTGSPPEYFKTGRSYFGDVNYFITLATNRTSLYVNGGIGAFIGAETYINPESQAQFLLGPKIDVETELFVSSRIAIIGRLAQYWNPFSDLKNWSTIWNTGVKILIY
jgi:hypothetical protein